MEDCQTPIKKKFTTEEYAHWFAAQIYWERGVFQYSYPCLCGDYHLTSSVPTAREAVRQQEIIKGLVLEADRKKS